MGGRRPWTWRLFLGSHKLFLGFHGGFRGEMKWKEFFGESGKVGVGFGFD